LHLFHIRVREAARRRFFVVLGEQAGNLTAQQAAGCDHKTGLDGKPEWCVHLA
jgi:hypothetical protein